MWTPENRPKYDRSRLRYPSDVTDEEWALIGPLIPPAKRGGNKRTIEERAVLDGVMYILSTGCQWAALPKDMPPKSTVHDHLRRWDEDRTLDRIHHALYVRCRESAPPKPRSGPRSTTPTTPRGSACKSASTPLRWRYDN
jgi:transposase